MRSRNNPGFTLIEFLVVIAIIAIIIAMIIPAMRRARQSAEILACSSNLHQLYLALQSYVNENHGNCFWRGADLDTDGMEWYGYGGRESGNKNLGQANYFNRLIPRPLNRFTGGKIAIFRCPNDTAAPWTLDSQLTPYPAESQFDWVGNSYNFNANGYPLRPQPRNNGGLDEVKISSIRDASNTIVFYEACLYWGYDWHYAHKANTCFADGHVVFLPLPAQDGEYHWEPRPAAPGNTGAPEMANPSHLVARLVPKFNPREGAAAQSRFRSRRINGLADGCTPERFRTRLAVLLAEPLEARCPLCFSLTLEQP
jgi:prepilin-type N-terminal cleavage/methylation domain-containing protein/prepilin-type processing-associated H-X9-DG protein